MLDPAISDPMGNDLLQFLTYLPDHLFGLGLLFCRVSAAVMLLPGWGESDTPRMVRVGLAVAFTLVLYPPLATQFPGSTTAAADIGMIAAELAAGGLLGWLARIIALALPLAGQFMSIQAGLSSVLQPDPELGAQSAVLGQLFSRALPVLVLATGLYRLPLYALAGSYAVMPAGNFFAAGDATQLVVRAIGAYWSLAMRLAAPFFLSGLLWQGALGLVARLVPRVQIYVVSAPWQILGGLALLAMLISAVLQVWGDTVGAAWAVLPGH